MKQNIVQRRGYMGKRRAALRAAWPLTVPVMLGYIFLGIAFGVLLGNRGYGAGWAVLMSAFVYAGSIQFIAVDLLAGGFQLASAALLTLMVNARHLFYGLSMLDKFKGMGGKKPYLIFSLSDETYSLLCAAEPPEGVDRGWFFFWISLLNQSYWVLGSAVGGLLGSALPFDTTGIDFAMTALFVVIFVEQWEKSRNHLPALTGIAVTVVCLLVARDYFVPLSLCVILLLLLLFRRKLDQEVRP